MFLTLAIAGNDVCEIEVWHEKVPHLAKALESSLPITTVIQHGKIVGDLLFCGLPIVAQAENTRILQDVFRERRAQAGGAEGAVVFYNPRQQICLFYSDDLADEPFQVSYIGEVVKGAAELQTAGIACWQNPGSLLEIRLS